MCTDYSVSAASGLPCGSDRFLMLTCLLKHLFLVGRWGILDELVLERVSTDLYVVFDADLIIFSNSNSDVFSGHIRMIHVMLEPSRIKRFLAKTALPPHSSMVSLAVIW